MATSFLFGVGAGPAEAVAEAKQAADLGEGTNGTRITRASWIIESVLTPGSDGTEVVSQDKAVEVGTTSVEAETDGRYVRFELRKETFAPGIDPFVPRFARN